VKALRELPAAAAAAMDRALVGKGGSVSAAKAAGSVPAGGTLEGAWSNNLAWMEQQVGKGGVYW